MGIVMPQYRFWRRTMNTPHNPIKVPSSGDNNKVADRTFSHSAPKLWNSIPDRAHMQFTGKFQEKSENAPISKQLRLITSWECAG